nr:hypothetical protein [Tanacetum cinerariifolium]
NAHIGYNCPSKVPVISIPEPCNNQTINELPQALPIFHPTFHSKAESPFTLDSTPTYVEESPNVFNPPPQPSVYPCEFCGNDAYFGYYCIPQAPFIYPEPCYNQDFHFPQTFKMFHNNEFIKSCVENLVPNPSESEGENGCDVLAGFTTFSNVFFDDDYDSNSSNDQLLSDEAVREKIYSNPLFDEEIIPMEIDQHSFNVESNIIESMPNHDSPVIISSKIGSLFDEFTGELTLLKSIPPGIDTTDCHPEKEIRL